MQSSPWVDGLTIGEALRRVAARQPDAEALVFPRHGFRASYADYDRLVEKAARGLLGLDIGPGDRVAIWSTNRPEWVLLQIATARIGAVLVTVNPAFRESELRYVLHQSGARALFLTDRFKGSDYYTRTLAVLPELPGSPLGELAAAAASELRWVVALPEHGTPGMLTWAEMLEMGGAPGLAERVAQIEPALDPDEAINLQYNLGNYRVPQGRSALP